MDNKTSDRERLLKLIDGQPVIEQPLPVIASPERAKQSDRSPDDILARLLRFARNDKFLGLNKREIIILAIVCAAVLLFFISKFFMPGKKEMKTSVVSELATTSESPIPSRLPVEDSAAQGLGLRLVGVDWGETPVALMEDTKSGKTYFVRNHDKILGATVKQIEKNRVIVSYRGQNVELR